MHLPHSVSGRASKEMKKKPAEAVRIFNDTGTALEEFGITESGNEIQAYVKVSPGDSVSLGFEIPCTELQIVDIFVDGVLRESNITTSRPGNTHRGKVTKVCACEVRPSKAKGKLEYCDMVVEARDTIQDMNPSATGFEDLYTSAVGTIEVRILREMNPAATSDKDMNQEQADRGPTFEDNLRWWNVSRRVDPGIVAPTYQIGFVNGRKTQGNSRKNINRGIEGCYLWASFKFLYRAASDIQAAGFHTINNLPNLPSKRKIGKPANLTSKMANLQSAEALPVNKSSLPPKPASGLSINQIDSDSPQPPGAGLVTGLDDGESTGYAKILKEELNRVTPIKLAQASNSMVAASDADQKAREVKANQGPRSLQARYETDYGENETESMKPSNISSFEITNQKRAKYEPLIEEKMSIEAPLPGSHRSAIIDGEQAIATSAEEAVMTEAHAKSNLLILSQPKRLHDNTAINESPGSHDGSRDLSDYLDEDARQPRDRRMETLADSISSKTDPTGLTEHSGPLQINSRESEEAACRFSVPKPPLDVSHLPPSPSLSFWGESESADQEIGIDQKLGVAHVQWVRNVQRTAPHKMMRTKAGHYASRSPLVDPDTAELEEHVKAMTNGKDDWRGRATQMLQALSVSRNNHASPEDSSSRSDPQPYASQKLATEVLPNSISDRFKKRKFGEVDIDSADTSPLNSGRPLSVDKLGRLRMSAKERREELVRKKRAKQEELENAKAEADALRRQVEEIEAGQAEAIAREEAELEELDIEMKNIKDETLALAARLRELHE